MFNSHLTVPEQSVESWGITAIHHNKQTPIPTELRSSRMRTLGRDLTYNQKPGSFRTGMLTFTYTHIYKLSVLNYNCLTLCFISKWSHYFAASEQLYVHSLHSQTQMKWNRRWETLLPSCLSGEQRSEPFPWNLFKASSASSISHAEQEESKTPLETCIFGCKGNHRRLWSDVM